MCFHEYFETKSSWDRPTWDSEVQIPKEDGGGGPFEISFCVFLNPTSFFCNMHGCLMQVSP